MSHLISITENLKNDQALTPSRFIGVSAINLINAGILANSSKECAEEARRIYKRRNGGMWRKIHSSALKVMQLAEQHQLTIEKPYFIDNGIVYGIIGDSISPLFGKDKIK